MLKWLWGAVAQWSEHLQLKQEALGLIPGGYPGFFWLTNNVDEMKDLWCDITVRLLSTEIRIGQRICGALVQFGCYQHRHE